MQQNAPFCILIFPWFYHTVFKFLTTQILYPKCSRMHHFASFWKKILGGGEGKPPQTPPLPLLVSRGLACMLYACKNLLSSGTKWRTFTPIPHKISICFVTAGNRHKQNSWFCKEIREDNFRFWWRRVHEDASQGMYMSKIKIFFFAARILQNQRMLCCGECFHD